MNIISKNYISEPFYIFFDVDGVLNCKSDWNRRFTLNKSCLNAFGALDKHFSHPIYIISSTWRVGKSENNIQGNPYDDLQRSLASYGIKILGSTPQSNKTRQEEISYYLRRNCNNTQDYIILDDDPSLFSRPDDINLYCTNYNTGLTEKDTSLIIRSIQNRRRK